MSAVEARLRQTAKRCLPPFLHGPCGLVYCGMGRWLRDRRDGVRESAWRVSPSGRHNQQRLRQLRDSCQGKRCFVIGNGPSLSQTDLTRLAGEITIGCNNLFLMFDRMGFRPTFYTVEDTLVAQDRADEIRGITGVTKVFPRDVARWLRSDDATVYVNFARSYPGFPRFSGNLNQVAYWGGTVTLFNLQLAYYIGCREVYLIGIDHNYTIPADLDPTVDGVIVSQGADVNHFDPNYFGQGYRYHNPRVERMENAYVAAREFAAAHGMKIYNATIGGKLEVFPRVDYDKVTESPGAVHGQAAHGLPLTAP